MNTHTLPRGRAGPHDRIIAETTEASSFTLTLFSNSQKLVAKGHGEVVAPALVVGVRGVEDAARFGHRGVAGSGCGVRGVFILGSSAVVEASPRRRITYLRSLRGRGLFLRLRRGGVRLYDKALRPLRQARRRSWSCEMTVLRRFERLASRTPSSSPWRSPSRCPRQITLISYAASYIWARSS